MNSYWEFYDKLIREVKNNEIITEVTSTPRWMFVRTDKGHIGSAMNSDGKPFDKCKILGMKLSDAAQLVKSWNFSLASVGMAAINASINCRDHFPSQDNPDAFLRYWNMFPGKNVVSVGHFSFLESSLSNLCNLTMLERSPQGNDLPDPACEYVIPDADIVIITGSAVINKTMPRLLELSKNAFTIITGPSTPLSEVLFDYGVNSLCGFCVTDDNVISDLTKNNNLAEQSRTLFNYGDMICLENT